jgi:peptidoglycan/LPS O-acetylase OafA/YrhL
LESQRLKSQPGAEQAESGFAEAIRSRHMPALDGLRAVAAFSVVAAHGYNVSLLDGVTVFFVLSGFLITTLLLREQQSTGMVSLRAFYARRTLRIFPAYYACVVASYIIDRVAGNAWPAGLAPSAFAYVVNYFNAFHGHPPTSIAHLWSLGVEEQFYLLWPAAFIALSRLGVSALQRGLIALIAVATAWRFLLYFGGFVGQAYLYNTFDARFDNLAIGCLLATVATGPAATKWVTRVAAHSWAPLVTLALMTLVDIGMSSIGRHLAGFTIYSALVAILIAQLLHLSRSSLWRWLESTPARFLGTISYPIYLYHGWGLGLGHWLTKWPALLQFGAGVVFTVLGAVGSYYIIERPFLKMKQRFAADRSSRTIAPKLASEASGAS